MKFRWKALALAPLAAPFIFSLAACVETKTPVFSFFFFFLLGSIFSYATTIVLFMPGLYCLSKFTNLRFYKVCLLGTFLGFVILFPVTWIMYTSSGPDSGPPEGTYFAFLSRSWADVTTWLFPVGGLITGIAYWLLLERSSSRNAEPLGGEENKMGEVAANPINRATLTGFCVLLAREFFTFVLS